MQASEGTGAGEGLWSLGSLASGQSRLSAALFLGPILKGNYWAGVHLAQWVAFRKGGGQRSGTISDPSLNHRSLSEENSRAAKAKVTSSHTQPFNCVLYFILKRRQ